MHHVLLEDGEDPGRRPVPGLAETDRRAPDPHAVAVHVKHLFGQVDDDHDRSRRRDLWMPHVLSRRDLRREGRDRLTREHPLGLNVRSRVQKEQRDSRGDREKTMMWHEVLSFLHSSLTGCAS